MSEAITFTGFGRTVTLGIGSVVTLDEWKCSSILHAPEYEGAEFTLYGPHTGVQYPVRITKTGKAVRLVGGEISFRIRVEFLREDAPPVVSGGFWIPFRA